MKLSTAIRLEKLREMRLKNLEKIDALFDSLHADSLTDLKEIRDLESEDFSSSDEEDEEEEEDENDDDDGEDEEGGGYQSETEDAETQPAPYALAENITNSTAAGSRRR